MKLHYLCAKSNLDQAFKYNTFGLNILSEIEIPELPAMEFQRPDISIALGKNPDNLADIKGKGVLYQAKKDDFLFKLDTVGSYRVREGKTITIEKNPVASAEEIRLFLLGSAFGAILLQRGLLPLHGSSVVKNNIAFVFCGPSGSGKSSLAATFVKRGYKLLADDISVVSQNTKGPLVYPGIPHLKLWEDVMKKMNEDLSKYPKVRPQLLKYRKPLDGEFVNKITPLSCIIVLNTKNSSGFELSEVKGSEKFNLIKNNTFRYQYLPGLDKTSDHFKGISELATQSQVYRLKRPSAPLQLEELADFIESRIINKY